MKKLLSLVLFVCIFLCCTGCGKFGSAQAGEIREWEKERGISRAEDGTLLCEDFVNSTNEMVHIEYKDGKISKYVCETQGTSNKRKNTWEYDDQGNETKFIEYDEEAGLNDFYSFEYNPQGQLTEMTACRKDDTPFYSVTYEYDSHSNLTRTDHYIDDILDHSIIYEYDLQGNKIRESYYEDDNLNYYISYEYDANKNKIREFVCLGNGTFRHGKSYEYDANGNLTRYEIYDENIELVNYFEYDYAFQYDVLGDITAIREFYKGEPGQSCNFEYDSNGRMTDQFKYSPDFSKVHEKIEYDLHGNFYGIVNEDGNYAVRCLAESGKVYHADIHSMAHEIENEEVYTRDNQPLKARDFIARPWE